MTQVASIREILEDDLSDNDSDTPPPETPPVSQNFDIILFGTSSCAINPSVIEPPAKSAVGPLLEIYLHRVDPVFKVTHAPTLRAILLKNGPRYSGASDSPALAALKFSVYFTAVCAQNEAECLNMLQETKRAAVDRFRLATEIMLSQAKLQTTGDITVLQAFVIYLVRHAFAIYICRNFRNANFTCDARLEGVDALVIARYRHWLQPPSELDRT